MPIDKFGRHFHDSRHGVSSSPIFIKVKNISDLYIELPIQIIGLKPDTDGFFKLGRGSTEYHFPLASAFVIEETKSMNTIDSYINDILVGNLSGKTLKRGDVLKFRKQNSHTDVTSSDKTNLMWITVIVKCPLQGVNVSV